MAAKHEQLTITIVGKQMGRSIISILDVKFCTVDYDCFLVDIAKCNSLSH